MLLDVGDTDVLVGVDISGGWDKLTGQDVDQSGLSSTVGTNDGNTGTERALEVAVAGLLLLLSGTVFAQLATSELFVCDVDVFNWN